MDPMLDYARQVYAGVLGKVIGVYMGRPFEGWSKDRIEARWGRVDRYVHADVGQPLVVPDDDISGTLTFIRALADSGLYGETPPGFFGDTWLNYLIEGKTVLWWGGMGNSTEHTAYLRLKHGMRSPLSGAVETNGATVAEQIGAQIFIDGCGMVAPGRPDLAAELARRSASVSHGGEAVHAAVVVAGMISAAFEEKDMTRLLDIGVGLIPADSLIAQVHRDVRRWAAEDGDWRQTYERIAETYGYHIYGGNCHVVPNHAIMVMAWCYAPDNFRQSQMIINTAGWDTDCNAANVGTLMGIVVGLDRICEDYDFRTPMADRIILPTAEGTRGVTDCLTEALHLCSIGRRVMGWEPLPPPKQGAWHHFSQPGAVHGYMLEGDESKARATIQVSNALSTGSTEGQLRLDAAFPEAGTARVSTPILPPKLTGGYGVQATPRLYPGMRVTATCRIGQLHGHVEARLFARFGDAGQGVQYGYGQTLRLEADTDLVLTLDLSDINGMPVTDFGFEFHAGAAAQTTLFCSQVGFAGQVRLTWPDVPPNVHGAFPGWIVDADIMRGSFSDDRETVWHVGKNEGRGILVTGTRDWSDISLQARVKIHMAEKGGLLIRYQGLERYVALVRTRESLQLLRRWYGKDQILGEVTCAWGLDELHELRLVGAGTRIQAYAGERLILEAHESTLLCGGAGFVFENGLMGFREIAIRA